VWLMEFFQIMKRGNFMTNMVIGGKKNTMKPISQNVKIAINVVKFFWASISKMEYPTKFFVVENAQMIFGKKGLKKKINVVEIVKVFIMKIRAFHKNVNKY
jgi:hypothetical protein